MFVQGLKLRNVLECLKVRCVAYSLAALVSKIILFIQYCKYDYNLMKFMIIYCRSI